MADAAIVNAEKQKKKKQGKKGGVQHGGAFKEGNGESKKIRDGGRQAGRQAGGVWWGLGFVEERGKKW